MSKYKKLDKLTIEEIQCVCDTMREREIEVTPEMAEAWVDTYYAQRALLALHTRKLGKELSRIFIEPVVDFLAKVLDRRCR